MPISKRTRVGAQTFVRKGDGTVSISPMVAGTLTAETGTLLFVRKSKQQKQDESKTGLRAVAEEKCR